MSSYLSILIDQLIEAVSAADEKVLRKDWQKDMRGLLGAAVKQNKRPYSKKAKDVAPAKQMTNAEKRAAAKADGREIDGPKGGNTGAGFGGSLGTIGGGGGGGGSMGGGSSGGGYSGSISISGSGTKKAKDFETNNPPYSSKYFETNNPIYDAYQAFKKSPTKKNIEPIIALILKANNLSSSDKNIFAAWINGGKPKLNYNLDKYLTSPSGWAAVNLMIGFEDFDFMKNPFIIALSIADGDDQIFVGNSLSGDNSWIEISDFIQDYLSDGVNVPSGDIAKIASVRGDIKQKSNALRDAYNNGISAVIKLIAKDGGKHGAAIAEMLSKIDDDEDDVLDVVNTRSEDGKYILDIEGRFEEGFISTGDVDFSFRLAVSDGKRGLVMSNFMVDAGDGKKELNIYEFVREYAPYTGNVLRDFWNQYGFYGADESRLLDIFYSGGVDAKRIVAALPRTIGGFDLVGGKSNETILSFGVGLPRLNSSGEIQLTAKDGSDTVSVKTFIGWEEFTISEFINHTKV